MSSSLSTLPEAERPSSSATISLFRPEVTESHQANRQHGNASLFRQPTTLKLASWLIAIIVVAGIGLLGIGQYSRKVTASGYLVPIAGTAKIFPLQRGTVTKVEVSEGQEVQEGQSLLTIDTGQISAAGEDINATILATLSEQKEQLKRQIADEELRKKSEEERLTLLIEGLKAEIDQIQAQIPLQQKRIDLAESLVTSIAQLAEKGTISGVELKKRQAEFLDQEQALASLKQNLPARQNQLTDTQYNLAQLPIVIEEKVQLLRDQLSAVEQRIAEINGKRAYVIRSPVTGRVTALQASVGKIAEPQYLQLEIIPHDSVLEAALFVPSRAIGFVSVGQQVNLRYDAFPYQNFGHYEGRIVEVSQNILSASDTASAPIALDGPAYRVTVSLGRQDVDAYGKRMSLQPGMLLKGDVVLDRRSLASWLLDPLLSAKG